MEVAPTKSIRAAHLPKVDDTVAVQLTIGDTVQIGSDELLLLLPPPPPMLRLWCRTWSRSPLS
jgi:hypothetical protein